MYTYLILTVAIFIIGFLGMFILKKHILNIIISLELLLLSININFIVISCFSYNMNGQIYSLMMLTLAAVETAIGLSIVIVYYRIRGGISLDLLNLLKS